MVIERNIKTGGYCGWWSCDGKPIDGDNRAEVIMALIKQKKG